MSVNAIDPISRIITCSNLIEHGILKEHLCCRHCHSNNPMESVNEAYNDGSLDESWNGIHHSDDHLRGIDLPWWYRAVVCCAGQELLIIGPGDGCGYEDLKDVLRRMSLDA